jgi:hypothetical protein
MITAARWRWTAAFQQLNSQPEYLSLIRRLRIAEQKSNPLRICGSPPCQYKITAAFVAPVFRVFRSGKAQGFSVRADTDTALLALPDIS